MRTHRAAVAALILALSIAPAALAAEQESEVDETLVVAANIAAVVPASLTYTPDTVAGAGFFRADPTLYIDDIETDFPTGLTVYITATPLVGPGATIPLADRQLEFIGPAGPFTRSPIMYGDSSITDQVLATTGAPLVGGALEVDAQVRNVTIPGAYTGTLTLTFATNG